MGLIESVANPLPVKRHTAGAYIEGRWVAATTSDITVPLAVQPARAVDVAHFPEGFRTRGAITLYSETPLQVADERTGVVADVVTYDGRDWKVESSAKYEGFGLLAYKAIAGVVDLAPEEA